MYYFEQLLYEAASPRQVAPVSAPTPKPVTYAPPKPQVSPALEQQKQLQAQQEQPVQKTKAQAQPAEDDFDFSGEDFSDEEGDMSQDPNSSLVPIKRYYLIQKLFALNDKLNQLRIKNDVLSLVILFIDSFSYESLLSLSNRLVEDIYLQIKDTSKTPETT